MAKGSSGVRLPARASMWYVGSNIASKAVGMLLTPIFTRVLSGAEYGGYTLYMSWLGLASKVALGCISQNVVYKGFQLFGDGNKFIYSALGAAWFAALPVTGAVAAAGIFFGLPIGLIPVFLLQVLCDTVINVSAMRMRYSYSYKSIVISSSVQSFLSPIISLVLIRFFDFGAEGRIYGLLSVSLIISGVLLFLLKRGGGRLYDGEVWRFLLGRSAKLLPYLLAGALISQADKLMLSRIHGDAALAKYSVAHTVGMGLVFVVGGISSSLNPWIMRKLKSGNSAAVEEIGWLLAKSFSAAALFIVAIAPEAIRFLAPSEYGEALPAVLPIALTTLPYFVTGFCTVGATFAERGGRCSVGALPAAVVNLALGMLLIPEFRYTGAALSMLLAHLTMAASSYFALKKCGLSTIPKLARTVGCFLLSAVWGGLIALAYPSFSARTLLLIPPALVLTGAAFDARDKIMESGA